jgi:hypothetical protein
VSLRDSGGGQDEIYAGFADTRCEDADLYRFLDDVERVAGIPIVRLSNGLNCWDVWHKFGMFTVGMSGGCKASWELKKGQLEPWMASIGKPEECIVYIGYNHKEDERVNRLRDGRIWTFDYPMRWKPYMSRCDEMDFLRAKGIEPPECYAKGYPHNNCGKKCIFAGIAQWCGVLKDDREGFLHYEEEEQKFIAMLKEKDRTVITILKDRRGGIIQNLSLRQLREEIEAGIREPKDTWRQSTCSCTGMLF